MKPLYSVIVCTHVGGRDLTHTLRSVLIPLSGEAISELVVAVSGVSDSSEIDKVVLTVRRVLGEKAHPIGGSLNVRVAWTRAHGLLAGRNIGVQSASSEFLAFVDDDYEVGKDWVAAVEEIALDPSIEMATGPTALVFTEDRAPTWLGDFEKTSLDGARIILPLSGVTMPDVKSKRVDPRLVFGQNFLIRRSLLDRAGGFGPDLMPRKMWFFSGDGETRPSVWYSRIGGKAHFDQRLAGLHRISPSRTGKLGLWNRARYDVSAVLFQQAQSRGIQFGLVARRSIVAMIDGFQTPTTQYFFVYQIGLLFWGARWLLKYRLSNEMREWISLSDYQKYLDPWTPVAGGWQEVAI